MPLGSAVEEETYQLLGNPGAEMGGLCTRLHQPL